MTVAWRNGFYPNMSETGARPLEWNDAQLAAFWGYYAEQRREDYFTHRFGQRILEVTREFYPRDALVCDYGCGPGFLLEKLVATHRAVGCDFSEANIAQARSRVGGQPNLVATFTTSAVPPDLKCDVLYAVETVEHILDRHADAFFSNINKLLRSGGVVIATTPNAEDLIGNTVFCPCCQHTFHRWQHVRSFDGASLSAFFEAHGFRTARTFTTDFAAGNRWQKTKARMRPLLGRRNPHLVYVGRAPGK